LPPLFSLSQLAALLPEFVTPEPVCGVNSLSCKLVAGPPAVVVDELWA